MENIEEYIYHFGLDHLEIYGTSKDDDFIISKKVKTFLGYDIEHHFNIPKYTYKIIFKKDNDTIYAYYKGIKFQTIPTKDYIIIYSTWFRLILEEDIKFFLLQFNLWRVKRFDIAADLLIDINSVLWTFKELNQRWATFNGPGWEIETQYIWDKKRRNKRQLIRIYDKIKDIQNRRKNTLYQDYLLQKNVTRVELEIRSELAKNRYYEYLFDVEVLLWIFKNYLWKHTTIFESLPWDKITLFQKKHEIINSNQYQSTVYRDKRNKVFIWHARGIFDMWYCPVRVLIWEQLIQDSTMRFLDANVVERIWEIEIDIKRDEHFRREEMYKRKSSKYKKDD